MVPNHFVVNRSFCRDGIHVTKSFRKEYDDMEKSVGPSLSSIIEENEAVRFINNLGS